MLTLKDEARFISYQIFLGEPEMNHVRPTRIPWGHFPLGQMQLSCLPNSCPVFLTFGSVHIWSRWGTEALWKQDVINGLFVLRGLSFSSKDKMISLPRIV